jgi:hypothetical protein
VGKLGRQGRLNAVVPGSLVHIVDQLSNRRFLVDTARSPSSEVALPATAWQEDKPEFSPGSPAAQPAVCAVQAFPDMLDFAAIAEHQRSCQVTLQASKSSSLQLRAVEVMGASLLCDFSTGVPRPLIPVVDRQKVFSAFHSLAHAGTRATRRLIAARAVWRNSDVAAWVRDCQACCRGKVTTQPAAPVQPIAVPVKRFSHVHLDLVGPLPVAADGSTYLLTMVDRTTRWLEAAPLRTKEAAVCADAFIAV